MSPPKITSVNLSPETIKQFLCNGLICFSLANQIDDRMKHKCSLQQIPGTLVLGLLELNCDWLKLKIPMSQKLFPGSGSQTLFLVETSDSQKYIFVHRLIKSHPLAP